MLLDIKDLRVKAENKEILKGLSLSVNAGEVHAIMGPNGSGKSTLARALAGHPGYEVTGGSITYDGKDLLELQPEERACEGLFMAFQYPVEITGVTTRTSSRPRSTPCANTAAKRNWTPSSSCSSRARRRSCSKWIRRC
jgi:Fe-S cluster assembly ATP-binding protein